MRFVRIPVSSQKPSDAAIDQFLAAMDDSGLYPVFVYCATGNRAAALWRVRRVLRDGWALADAEIEAERAGLSSAEMRGFAREYIRRQVTRRAGAPRCAADRGGVEARVADPADPLASKLRDKTRP